MNNPGIDLLGFGLEPEVVPHFRVPPEFLLVGLQSIVEIDGVDALTQFVELPLNDDHWRQLKLLPILLLVLLHDFGHLDESPHVNFIVVDFGVVLQVAGGIRVASSFVHIWLEQLCPIGHQLQSKSCKPCNGGWHLPAAGLLQSRAAQQHPCELEIAVLFGQDNGEQSPESMSHDENGHIWVHLEDGGHKVLGVCQQELVVIKIPSFPL